MPTTIKQARVYEPGRDITAEVVTAAVVGRKFVKIGGNRTDGGSLAVTIAASGDRAFGVAAEDAAVGSLVRVVRGGVVRVIATGSINAGAEVQVGTGGNAAAKSSGVAVGYAVTGAADGGIAEISLY